MNLDQFRRIHNTLRRRVAARDPANVVSIGFDPGPADRGEPPVVARFDVEQVLRRVPAKKRIGPTESVRLLDRKRDRFRTLALKTRVRPAAPLQPTGVRVFAGKDRATTSIAVRWTTVRPVPPRPNVDRPDDPRWRWGLLTVSHLFVGHQDDGGLRPRVRRFAHCGDGPEAIRGRIASRGRIPGGPDVALLETGWDRLWLSGFMPAVGLPRLIAVSGGELASRASRGGSGQLIAARVEHRWRWRTFYPSLMIPGLGRLRHVVAYELDPTRTSTRIPFGPGVSGAALLAGGAVLGLQVAAEAPRFRVGYAQTLDISLPWLRKRTNASAFDLVHVF